MCLRALKALFLSVNPRLAPMSRSSWLRTDLFSKSRYPARAAVFRPGAGPQFEIPVRIRPRKVQIRPLQAVYLSGAGRFSTQKAEIRLMPINRAGMLYNRFKLNAAPLNVLRAFRVQTSRRRGLLRGFCPVYTEHRMNGEYT